MRSKGFACLVVWLIGFVALLAAKNAFSQIDEHTNARIFAAKGIVREIRLDEMVAVIEHGAISNFMHAMTMPFQARDQADLVKLSPGDQVSFDLHVAQTNSWIEKITKTGTSPIPVPFHEVGAQSRLVPGNTILDYKFTNELGQAVAIHDFRGQALAVTFFYTRCPLPEFCPRLSKNFELVQQKIEALADAPTNWHLISVSFDAEFDSPDTLKAYGQQYQYDSNRWSFLTGPADKIAELARVSSVKYEASGGLINHNFRTLVIDASARLQMVFPTGGDLSDQIVTELLRAAAATNNPPLSQTGQKSRTGS